MGSVLWLPVAFASCSLILYFISTQLPPLPASHPAVNSSALNFPSNLEELQSLASLLEHYRRQHLSYVILLYSSAYLFKQTFAIPGSVFMNLLGGALFGQWIGFLLTCLLSASGATACFLLAKVCGRSYIQKYFPDQLKKVQDKISENSDSLFFFLMFLRLFPMTPNWFLNISSPICGVPIHLFFLSVFFGLMPYNFICVQTGCLLSTLKSLDDIFSAWTMFKLFSMATAALVPGLLIKRYQQMRSNVKREKEYTEKVAKLKAEIERLEALEKNVTEKQVKPKKVESFVQDSIEDIPSVDNVERGESLDQEDVIEIKETKEDVLQVKNVKEEMAEDEKAKRDTPSEVLTIVGVRDDGIEDVTDDEVGGVGVGDVRVEDVGAEEVLCSHSEEGVKVEEKDQEKVEEREDLVGEKKEEGKVEEPKGEEKLEDQKGEGGDKLEEEVDKEKEGELLDCEESPGKEVLVEKEGEEEGDQKEMLKEKNAEKEGKAVSGKEVEIGEAKMESGEKSEEVVAKVEQFVAKSQAEVEERQEVGANIAEAGEKTAKVGEIAEDTWVEVEEFGEMKEVIEVEDLEEEEVEVELEEEEFGAMEEDAVAAEALMEPALPTDEAIKDTSTIADIAPHSVVSQVPHPQPHMEETGQLVPNIETDVTTQLSHVGQHNANSSVGDIEGSSHEGFLEDTPNGVPEEISKLIEKELSEITTPEEASEGEKGASALVSEDRVSEEGGEIRGEELEVIPVERDERGEGVSAVEKEEEKGHKEVQEEEGDKQREEEKGVREESARGTSMEVFVQGLVKGVVQGALERVKIELSHSPPVPTSQSGGEEREPGETASLVERIEEAMRDITVGEQTDSSQQQQSEETTS